MQDMSENISSDSQLQRMQMIRSPNITDITAIPAGDASPLISRRHQQKKAKWRQQPQADAPSTQSPRQNPSKRISKNSSFTEVAFGNMKSAYLTPSKKHAVKPFSKEGRLSITPLFPSAASPPKKRIREVWDFA